MLTIHPHSCAVKIIYVVFGYIEASYRICGRLRNGDSGQDDISKRLWALTARIQLDIIHHGFETHNQAISAAGASKNTELK
jgi:hypothetical protein